MDPWHLNEAVEQLSRGEDPPLVDLLRGHGQYDEPITFDPTAATWLADLIDTLVAAGFPQQTE